MTTPTTAQPAEKQYANGGPVVWLLLVAAFVVILNETIMNVALHPLMQDLHVSARAAQWLSSAFMLTSAVVIPVTGFLIQRFSTRALFVAAMGLFTLGTLAAALAPGFGVLLAARIVQACGTAIMLPLLMTTLMTVVPPNRRGRVMGNMSVVISVAPALGPTISGLVLHALNWRWMFGIVFPLALVMLIVGARWMRNVGENKPTPVDTLSVVLSAFGFGGVVYGLSRIGEGSGSGGSWILWLSLAVGAVSLVLFVLRQRSLQREDRALLDLRTFRFPIFTVAAVLMAISMLAMFGTLILLPIYLEQVLGLDPLATGLLMLPGGLLMAVVAPIVGRLYDRMRSPRLLVVPGAVIAAGTLGVLATVSEHTSPWTVLVIYVVLNVGLELMFTPLFTAGLGAVPKHLYSHGSAIISTLQQVAGAAGAALFVTLMAAQQAVLAADGAAPDAAAAGGVRQAFLVGAVLSLVAVVGAFFVRKPADVVNEPEDPRNRE